MNVNEDTHLLEFAAGNLSFVFDRQTLFVRRVEWKGVEVIRAIYAAVRDQNWGTVPPKLQQLNVERSNDSVQITFAAECIEGEIDYSYEGKISCSSRRELSFEFTGFARSDFLRNRVGLCLLHPIQLCAGAGCAVEHTDGGWEHGEFPRLVAAHQPFERIRRLRHPVDGNTDVEITFEGEVFEMEDQRNWTDSSFKTYCTPLALPFPVRVHKEEQIKQSITIKLLEKEGSKNEQIGHLVPPKSDAFRVCIDFHSSRNKPALGFCVGADTLSEVAAEQLRRVRPDHLRMDCRMWERDWERRLEQAVTQARLVGAGLHVAAFLDGGESELIALSEACLSLNAPVTCWLILPRRESCTPVEVVRTAQSVLLKSHPNVPLAAGTDAYFAELDRERPPTNGDWHPCFSINPQVHATDNLSILENIEAQADVVRSATAFSGNSIVISPITLRPRFNPYATTDSPESPSCDPRQNSRFAAAWTFGSLATLAQCEGVLSLTYFETAGPGGIMSADGAELFPVYRIFSEFTELAALAHVSISDQGQATVSAMGGIDAFGRKVILLGNHSLRAARVWLETTPTKFRLLEINYSGSAQARLRTEIELINGTVEIEIPPLGVTRLEAL